MAIGIDPGPVDGVAERLAPTSPGGVFVKQRRAAGNCLQRAPTRRYSAKGREEIFVTLAAGVRGHIGHGQSHFRARGVEMKNPPIAGPSRSGRGPTASRVAGQSQR